MASMVMLPMAGYAEEHTIMIEAMKFQPKTIVVDLGDTVVWRNQDIVPHTTTAVHQFDSGKISPGMTWSWQASTVGRIKYVCTFHPDMNATLIVKITYPISLGFQSSSTQIGAWSLAPSLPLNSLSTFAFRKLKAKSCLINLRKWMSALGSKVPIMNVCYVATPFFAMMLVGILSILD
jgi:plastocyanin